MQDAGGTTESFYILGSLLLLNNPSGSLILASQAILAVYHALSCGRSLGPLDKPLQPLSTMAGAHRERALFAMGFLDIIAFVQLLFHALTGGAVLRGLVQSFIYLNLVKNRSGLVRGVYTSLRAGNIREIWKIQGHGMDAGGM